MSQKGVEGLLGRMLTDSDFRRRFYQDPAAACIAAAMEVTTRELEAVLTVEEARIAELSKTLDARIVRADVKNPGPQGTEAERATGGQSQSATETRHRRTR